MPYATPGDDILPIIDAPPTPLTYMAPGGRFVALVHYESHPPIAMLARPYLSLAGLRLDPQLGARRRTRRLTGLSVVRIADGQERALSLPAGPGRRAGLGAGRAPVGVHHRRARRGRRVGRRRRHRRHGQPGARADGSATSSAVIRSASGGTVRWSRDGARCSRSAAPAGPVDPARPPVEPQTRRDSGQALADGHLPGPATTAADEDAFEALATTVPLRVDPVTGEPGRARAARAVPEHRRVPPTGPTCWCTGCSGRSPSGCPWVLLRPPGGGVDRRRDVRVGHRRPAGQRRGAAAGRADRPAAGLLGGTGAGRSGLGGGAGWRRPGRARRAPRPDLPARRARSPASPSYVLVTASLPGLVRPGRAATSCCWPSTTATAGG